MAKLMYCEWCEQETKHKKTSFAQMFADRKKGPLETGERIVASLMDLNNMELYGMEVGDTLYKCQECGRFRTKSGETYGFNL